MFSVKNSSKSYCSRRQQIRRIPLGRNLSRVPTLCPAFFTCWVLLTQVNSGDTAVMGVPEASQGRAGRSPEAVHHQGQADHPHVYPNIPPLGISQAPSHQQDKADRSQSSLGNGVAYYPIPPSALSHPLATAARTPSPGHLGHLGFLCHLPPVALSGLPGPPPSISSYDPHGMSQPLPRMCGSNSPSHTFLPLPKITRA